MVTPFTQEHGGVPVEPTPAPTVALDGHMRILDFNSAAESLLGYSRYEVVGRPLSSLLPEGLGIISLSRLQEAVARGEVGDIETHKALNLRHGQGYELPVEASISLTHDLKMGYSVIATLHELNPEQEAQMRQEVLSKVTARLENGGPWEELAAFLQVELNRVMEVDWLSIFLIKASCGLTRVLSWSGNEGAGLLESGQTVELAGWMEDQVALGESRTYRLRAQPTTDLERQLRDTGLKELLFVPLQNRKHTLGILALAGRKTGALTLEHETLVKQISPLLVRALERELVKSQAQVYRRHYHEMLEGMEDAVFSLDLEGRMEYANPALIKLLACNDLAELKLVTPDLFQTSIEKRGELVEQLHSQGWLNHRRITLVNCCGKLLCLTLSAHMVYDDDGRPLAIEGSLHDHTIRREPDQMVETDRPTMIDPVEQSQDPVLMADESGLIFQANTQAARMFNTTPEELVGRPIAKLVEELELAQEREEYEAHRQGRDQDSNQVHPVSSTPPTGKQTPAGRKERHRALNLTRAPTTPRPPEPEDPTPHPFPTLVDRMRSYADKLAEDIEQDHKLEQKEELEELKAQMAGLSANLDRLLAKDPGGRSPPADLAAEIADLAHQVEWLLERMRPFRELEDTAADLRQLKAQLDERLEQLAGSAPASRPATAEPGASAPPDPVTGLASALFEAVTGGSPGQLPQMDTTPLVLAPLNLNHLLESTLASLNDPLRAKATVLFKAGEVPPVLAQADQIEQVLTNLLLNAAEAIPSIGTISVTSRQQEDWVVVDISDDGEGLTREELDRIFEPFYTTRPEGQGLGLPLAQRIVTSHQGQLKVTSRKGTGSTFSLWLPTLKGQDRVAEDEERDTFTPPT